MVAQCELSFLLSCACTSETQVVKSLCVQVVGFTSNRPDFPRLMRLLRDLMPKMASANQRNGFYSFGVWVLITLMLPLSQPSF